MLMYSKYRHISTGHLHGAGGQGGDWQEEGDVGGHNEESLVGARIQHIANISDPEIHLPQGWLGADAWGGTFLDSIEDTFSF